MKVRVLPNRDTQVQAPNSVGGASAVPIEESPEVKSFIYQQIVDFEPFLTPTSLVSVVSKNPENLISKNSRKGVRHQIQISIRENGVSLDEYGTSENIYEAILEAKNKLYQKLVSIQDSVISEQDRLAQIHFARAGKMIH